MANEIDYSGVEHLLNKPSTSKSSGDIDYSSVDHLLGDKPVVEKPKASGKTQNKSGLADVTTSLKSGIAQIPSMVTGIADLPLNAMGFDAPVSRFADKIGEVSGFQPSKYAEEVKQDYSPAMQESRKVNNAVWDDPNTDWKDVAATAIGSPRAALAMATESVPSMVAGGLIGKGLQTAAGLKALTAADAAAGVTAKYAPKIGASLSAGLGEGSIMAGQSNESMRDTVADPQLRASTAATVGAIGGAIGAGSGAIANKLGVFDPNQYLLNRAGMEATEQYVAPTIGGKLAQAALGSAKSGITETAEELSQTFPEVTLKNLAEGKPYDKGLKRQMFDAGVAGGVMGLGLGGAHSAFHQVAGKENQPTPETQAAIDAHTQAQAQADTLAQQAANTGGLSGAALSGQAATAQADADTHLANAQGLQDGTIAPIQPEPVAPSTFRPLTQDIHEQVSNTLASANDAIKNTKAGSDVNFKPKDATAIRTAANNLDIDLYNANGTEKLPAQLVTEANAKLANYNVASIKPDVIANAKSVIDDIDFTTPLTPTEINSLRVVAGDLGIQSDPARPDLTLPKIQSTIDLHNQLNAKPAPENTISPTATNPLADGSTESSLQSDSNAGVTSEAKPTPTGSANDTKPTTPKWIAKQADSDIIKNPNNFGNLSFKTTKEANDFIATHGLKNHSSAKDGYGGYEIHSKKFAEANKAKESSDIPDALKPSGEYHSGMRSLVNDLNPDGGKLVKGKDGITRTPYTNGVFAPWFANGNFKVNENKHPETVERIKQAVDRHEGVLPKSTNKTQADKDRAILQKLSDILTEDERANSVESEDTRSDEVKSAHNVIDSIENGTHGDEGINESVTIAAQNNGIDTSKYNDINDLYRELKRKTGYNNTSNATDTQPNKAQPESPRAGENTADSGDNGAQTKETDTLKIGNTASEEDLNVNDYTSAKLDSQELDSSKIEKARKVVKLIKASIANKGVMGTVPKILRDAAKDIGVYDSKHTPDEMLAAVENAIKSYDNQPTNKAQNGEGTDTTTQTTSEKVDETTTQYPKPDEETTSEQGGVLQTATSEKDAVQNKGETTAKVGQVTVSPDNVEQDGWDKKLSLYIDANRSNDGSSHRTAKVAKAGVTGRDIQSNKQRVDLPTFSEQENIASLNFDQQKLKDAEHILENVADAALLRRQAMLDEIALTQELERLAETDNRIKIENNKNGSVKYTVFDDDGKKVSSFTRSPDKDNLDREAILERDKLRQQLVDIGAGKFEIKNLTLHVQPLDATSVNEMRDTAIANAKVGTIQQKAKKAADAHKAVLFFDKVIHNLKSVLYALFKAINASTANKSMDNDNVKEYKFRNSDNTVMFTLQKGKSEFVLSSNNSDIKGANAREKLKNIALRERIKADIDRIEKESARRQMQGKIEAATSSANKAVVIDGAVQRMLGIDNELLQALFQEQKANGFANNFKGFEASQVSWQLPTVSGQQNPDLDVYQSAQAKKAQESRWINQQAEQDKSEPDAGIMPDVKPNGGVKPESNDIYMGREWLSERGTEKVTDYTNGLYTVTSEDGSYRKYTFERIEYAIERDAYSLTDEFKKEKEESLSRIDKANKRREQSEAFKQQKEDDFNSLKNKLSGFTDGLDGKNKALKAKVLKSQTSIDNKVKPLYVHIEDMVSNGGAISSYEENKIKDMSRRAYNRANQEEQDAHDKKQREAGKKTVYLVAGYDLGKTAYDYADYLIKQKDLIQQSEATPSKPTPADKLVNQTNGTDKSEKERADEKMDELKAKMGQALSELNSLLGGKMNLTEEEETKLLPIMSKIFRIAAEMGYLKFKEAAGFVMKQIREALGDKAADKLSIENVQAGYINAKGKDFAGMAEYNEKTVADLEADYAKYVDGLINKAKDDIKAEKANEKVDYLVEMASKSPTKAGFFTLLLSKIDGASQGDLNAIQAMLGLSKPPKGTDEVRAASDKFYDSQRDSRKDRRESYKEALSQSKQRNNESFLGEISDISTSANEKMNADYEKRQSFYRETGISDNIPIDLVRDQYNEWNKNRDNFESKPTKKLATPRTKKQIEYAENVLDQSGVTGDLFAFAESVIIPVTNSGMVTQEALHQTPADELTESEAETYFDNLAANIIVQAEAQGIPNVDTKEEARIIETLAENVPAGAIAQARNQTATQKPTHTLTTIDGESIPVYENDDGMWQSVAKNEDGYYQEFPKDDDQIDGVKEISEDTNTITLDGKEIAVADFFKQLKGKAAERNQITELLNNHPDKQMVARIMAINEGVGTKNRTELPILEALVKLGRHSKENPRGFSMDC